MIVLIKVCLLKCLGLMREEILSAYIEREYEARRRRFERSESGAQRSDCPSVDR